MSFGTAEERTRLEADARYLAFLVQAGEMLSASLDYHETLENVCRASVGTIADLCLIDLGELGNTQLVSAAHRDEAATQRIFEEHAGKHLNSAPLHPMHPVCQVIQSGKTFYAPHIDDAWIDEHASCPDHAEFMRSMGYESMIVVPVRSMIYGITGALTLVTTKDGRMPLDADGVSFAEDLGRRCGAAIGKARIYAQAIDTAMRFQQAALPRVLPSLPSVSFDALYQPATSALLIGGDWYDAFAMPDGRILDPESLRLTCAPAGHPGPKIWTPPGDEIQDPFAGRGLPLGTRDLFEPEAPKTVQLAKGAFLVFYTDGLVEAGRDLAEGKKDLEAAMCSEEIRRAAEPARAIRDAMVGSTAPPDDLAILTLQIK